MLANDDDIENCLTSLGIQNRQLIPTNIAQRVLRQRPELNQFRNKINIFPLEWFDGDWQFFPDCAEGIEHELTSFSAILQTHD